MPQPILTVVPDDFPPVFVESPEMGRLRDLGRVEAYTSRAETTEELVRRLEGAAAVVNMRAFTRFTPAVFAALPLLRVIAVSGTGTDNIDLEAAARNRTIVCNTPEANSDSVAEHTFALLLALARGLRPMEDRMRAGEWWHHYGMELKGKTLGLVGLGRIAARVARMAGGFGMRVVGWSFTPDAERAGRLGISLLELDELLAVSDVVSLHLRLSDRSRGLLDAGKLARIRPQAYLVNTARGALVEEAALAAALRAGGLRGAALDCYGEEPLPLDHPLRSAPNTLLIPHAGWMTVEARSRMLSEPVDNIVAWTQGRPQNVVNPAALG